MPDLSDAGQHLLLADQTRLVQRLQQLEHALAIRLRLVQPALDHDGRDVLVEQWHVQLLCRCTATAVKYCAAADANLDALDELALVGRHEHLVRSVAHGFLESCTKNTVHSCLTGLTTDLLRSATLDANFSCTFSSGLLHTFEKNSSFSVSSSKFGSFLSSTATAPFSSSPGFPQVPLPPGISIHLHFGEA